MFFRVSQHESVKIQSQPVQCCHSIHCNLLNTQKVGCRWDTPLPPSKIIPPHQQIPAPSHRLCPLLLSAGPFSAKYSSVDDGATSQRILIRRPSLRLLAVQRSVADVVPAASSLGPGKKPGSMSGKHALMSLRGLKHDLGVVGSFQKGKTEKRGAHQIHAAPVTCFVLSQIHPNLVHDIRPSTSNDDEHFEPSIVRPTLTRPRDTHTVTKPWACVV